MALKAPLTDVEVGKAFTFILQETVRLARMGREAFEQTEGLEIFCALTSAEGHFRLIGRPAYEALREITNRALETSDHYRRVDPDAAFAEVRTGFGQTYFRKDFSGATDAEDLCSLRAWIDRAGRLRTTLTHFIPCQVGFEKGAPITIGPVTFQAREDAMAELEPTLKTWSALGETDEAKWRRLDLQKITSYFGAFQDIARVKVTDCDSKTSRAVANEVVHAALAYIHILAGAANTRRIRSGGPALRGDRRSSLALDPAGEPNLSWSTKWEGGHFDKDYWNWFRQPEQQKLSDAVGLALQAIIGRGEVPFAAARYLDAAAWYADAAREERTPAAIVKYLTAMERLLWTGEGYGVTKRLSERAAALCFTTETWNFEELRDQVAEAYDLRSGILHGRLSADDPIILRNYHLCETVARDLLLTWLDRYGWGFDRETTIAKAKAHFDGFVKDVKDDLRKHRAEARSASPSA